MSTTHAPPPGQTTQVALLVLVIIVYSAAATSALVTIPQIPNWYAELHKPFFAPSPWVFGPMWMVLYALMAVAAWRVWNAPASASARRQALGLFGIQLALNGIWPLVFFVLRHPGAALIVIMSLLIVLVFAMIRFATIDRAAAALLAPYLIWITFTAALNAGIIILN
jgi:tryptophan-rich sensory protein